MAEEFIPDSQFKPDPVAPSSGMSSGSASAPAFIPDHAFTPDEDVYGTPGQLALTAAEGVAKGVAGPLATGAEALLTKAGVPGLSPEEQDRRSETNPWVHGGAEAVGLVAPALLTGGASTAARAALEVPEAISLGSKLAQFSQAGLMESAGAKALQIAGFSEKPVGLAAKIGAGALKSAVETAAFQTGDEISKRINDPSLGVSDAAAHIGLSALIGAGAGGLFGVASPFWLKENEKSVSQSIYDFNAATGSGTGTQLSDHAAYSPLSEIRGVLLEGALRKQKSNAPELIDIANRNHWPIAEGMTSASKEIQMAEDALLTGPPTVASITRRKLYQSVYDSAGKSVDQAITSLGEPMTETQAGNAIKESLTSKLESENAPIKALYNEIEPWAQAIPVSDKSTGALSKNIDGLIREKGLIPGTDRYNYVKNIAENIDSITNLQQLKNFRTELWNSAKGANGPALKDLAGDISERLNRIETKSIRRAANNAGEVMASIGVDSPEMAAQAKDKMLSLVDKMEDAKGLYKNFREKLGTLGKSMGKKNIRGPQDFIDFVDEMNPQTLAKKLFNEKNTEFMEYFSKNFPEEMGIMRNYQRNLIKQESTKDGALLTKNATKKILGMEPEIQKILFTPEQLQTVSDAEKYLSSIPKTFNPSGTADKTAFREFFEHPTGAAIANLRDFGIKSFIKAFGRSVPGSETEAARILPLLGKEVGKKDVNPGAFKHAVDYAMAVIKGEAATGRAVKSIFNAAIPVGASVYPDQQTIDKLSRKLKEFTSNPDKHADVGGDVGHYLPNHDIVLKGVTASAVAYLNNLRPKTVKLSPLDPELEPSEEQNAKFHRALAIAEKPLSVISLLKKGVLTAEDVKHLNAIYPGLKNRLGEKITQELTTQVSKGEVVPYSIRFGLSTLMGQPMDSSMSPQSIMNNQASITQAAQEDAQKQGGGIKPTAKGMGELKHANRLSLDPMKNET